MKQKIIYSVVAGFLYLTISAYSEVSSPTDEIVVKAANAVIFTMNANLKLTRDQINAIQPIVVDNIVKVRNLQQSLEDGAIDGRDMYNQRQQLMNDEYQQLSSILTMDQMKAWIMIQNEDSTYSSSKPSNSK